ncbi:MAG: hypothetical protein QNK05_01270 [Myxococcota bacterium]|nr:hypothetical protein [Myxococcota bacterium]
MPVLGLVLVLDDASDATRACARAGLSGFPQLELGSCSQHRWPATLDTATDAEVEARVEAIRAVPGVAGVEVVYADFEDLLPEGA